MNPPEISEQDLLNHMYKDYYEDGTDKQAKIIVILLFMPFFSALAALARLEFGIFVWVISMIVLFLFLKAKPKIILWTNEKGVWGGGGIKWRDIGDVYYISDKSAVKITHRFTGRTAVYRESIENYKEAAADISAIHDIKLQSQKENL